MKQLEFFDTGRKEKPEIDITAIDDMREILAYIARKLRKGKKEYLGMYNQVRDLAKHLKKEIEVAREA